MIYGIGIDLVEIQRIKDMDNLVKFAEKILSDSELKLFKEKSSEAQATFLAKQFAAKEAVVKPLGTGFTANNYHKDIRKLRNAEGSPELQFSETLQEMVNNLGIKSWHVSLADEKTHAIAMVVLEQK